MKTDIEFFKSLNHTMHKYGKQIPTAMEHYDTFDEADIELFTSEVQRITGNAKLARRVRTRLISRKDGNKNAQE